MIVGWMPDARMEVTHDVGHWPHFERPEEFNKLAVEFLKEPARIPSAVV